MHEQNVLITDKLQTIMITSGLKNKMQDIYVMYFVELSCDTEKTPKMIE